LCKSMSEGFKSCKSYSRDKKVTAAEQL